jgi:hypothetical protein
MTTRPKVLTARAVVEFSHYKHIDSLQVEHLMIFAAGAAQMREGAARLRHARRRETCAARPDEIFH